MRKKRTGIKYFFFLLILFFLIAIKDTAQTPAEKIPTFTFFNPDKTVFTNKQLQTGKMLFFVFFDVSCTHCQHAIEYINKHYAELNKAAVYLISLDGWNKVHFFLDKYGPQLQNKTNIKILLDSDNEFITKFGPKKYPSMFLYSSAKRLEIYDDEPQNIPGFLKKINEKN